MRPDIVRTHPYIDQWRAKGYQYYIIPKAMLRTGPLFGLGMDEVALYAVLRDRVSLSLSNQWYDDQERVYIIFTREEASRLMGWSPRKTVDVFARLVDAGLLVEVEQRGAGVLKKPKRLFVKQWVEPSVLHSVEELRSGGFNYLTTGNVYADVGDYYVLPQCLLTDPIYEGLGLRPVLVYMLALDKLHLSIRMGQVDDSGLVWCHLDNEVVKAELGCSRNSLYQAYKDLETIGLMKRVRNGSNTKIQYRVYLRDYLSPPRDPAAEPQAQAGAKNGQPNICTRGDRDLHDGIPEFAPGLTNICTWEGRDLHLGVPNSAQSDAQNLHPINPSYPSDIKPSFLGTSIAGADATGGGEGDGKWDFASALGHYRRQTEAERLSEDIMRYIPPSQRGAALGLLDTGLRLMAEDMVFRGTHIRLGDKSMEREEALRRYRGIDRYILYLVLEKVSARMDSIRDISLYLHRALLQAQENHSGEAYYLRLERAGGGAQPGTYR